MTYNVFGGTLNIALIYLAFTAVTFITHVTSSRPTVHKLRKQGVMC